MRNPTFGRDSRNTNTFQNGANCASNYGGRPNSYHSQKLGSYRVSHYDAFKIPSDFLSTNPAWKEITPMSINLREETFHLSPVEQRVEDYYLIQKLMLEEKHKKHLQTCVQQKCFNMMLLDNKITSNLKVFPFSSDPPINIDKFRNSNPRNSQIMNPSYDSRPGYRNTSSGYNPGGYHTSVGNSYNSGGNYNTSANSFGSPFGNNPTNNNNLNPFNGGNSGMLGNPENARNNFGSSNNNCIPQSPFSNGNNNDVLKNSNSPFGGNNNSFGSANNSFRNSNVPSGNNNSYGNNNNSNSNNPYGNSNHSSPYGNIKGNVLGGNQNGSIGSNPALNPFVQNNSLNNNHAPISNRGSSGSFSLANNTSNANNANNNPFNTNIQNAFKKDNTEGDKGANSHLINYGNPNYNPFSAETNYFSNNGGGGNKSGGNFFGQNSYSSNLPNNGMQITNPFNNIPPELFTMQVFSKIRQIIQQKNSKNQKTEEEQLQSDLKEMNWVRDYGKARENEWGWRREYYDQPIQESKPKVIIIRRPKETVQRKTNVNESSFEVSSFYNKDNAAVAVFYTVFVKWVQNLKEESKVEGKLIFPYEPSGHQVEQKVLQEIKDIHSWIRSDAEISLNAMRNKGRKTFEVEGIATHRKINVPVGYDYLPQKFENFEVKGLTISNKYGKVEWPQLVNVKDIDFKNSIGIHRNCSSIESEELEKYIMIITINSLPRSVSRASQEDGRRDLQKCIRKFGDNARLINFNLELETFTFQVKPDQ